MRRLYIARARRIVFASEYEADTSLLRGRASEAVVAHAVFDDRNADDFLDRARADAALRVGYLGRFDKKKNIELLIDAVALVDDATLTLAGSGVDPSPQSLSERAERAGLAGRVELLGWLQADELDPFFKRIDVLAMPSTHECFGMAAAEALAAGVPVLVSPTTGLAGLVTRRSCGCVVPPVVEAVAQEFRRLRDDRGVLREQRLRAQTAAAEELSFSAHGVRMLKLYGAIITPTQREG
jgi:glycosyltransferase involved in cell wall biosynthesis